MAGTREPSLWTAVAVLGVSIIALTFWLQRETVRKAEIRQRYARIDEIEAVARTVRPERIRALDFSETDLDRPEYQRLQAQFTACAEALGLPRLYSMSLREGRLRSGPASRVEPVSGVVPPGAEMRVPHPGFIDVFHTGLPALVGPYQDAAGYWVTALAPVRDAWTGGILAVIGIDFEADTWHASLRSLRRWWALYGLLLLLALLGGALLIELRRRRPAARRGTRLYLEAGMCMVLGGLCTLGAIVYVNRVERLERDTGFQRLARANALHIADEFREVGMHLDALSRFFDASVYVDREEFFRYTEPLTRHPIAREWLWIPSVPEEEVSAAETDARSEEVHDYRVWSYADGERIPAPARERHFPAHFVEPAPARERWLGYDLGSDPHLAGIIEESLRTGLPVAAPPLSFPMESEAAGIVVVQPAVSAVQSGLVGAVLSVERILDTALLRADGRETDIGVALFLLEAGRRPSPLLVTGDEEPRWPGPCRAALCEYHPIFRFGQVYLLSIYPQASWLAAHPLRLGWAAGALGGLVTGTVTLLILVLAGRGRRLEEAVTSRTADLQARETELKNTLGREAHVRQVLLAIRNVNQLIVKETDPRKLIAQACDQLTGTLGYRHAIILRMDEKGEFLDIAASGRTPGLERLRDRLKEGSSVACLQDALSSETPVVIRKPGEACSGCPLAGAPEGCSGFVGRMAHGGRPYGVLFAFMSRDFVQDETQRELFRELTEDLGFALDKIRKEDAEQARETLIQTLLNHLPLGLAVNTVEPGVAFEYMNDLFPRIYRTTRAALQRVGAFWEAVYPDPVFREKIQRRVEEDVASGDPDRMVWENVPIERPGQETTYVTARNIPIPGQPVMLSTVMDVTDHYRAGERLQQALRETRRLLAEAEMSRKALLSLMEDQRIGEQHRKRLEAQLLQSQKMEAIGRLAGGVAHDFNNMLQAILGGVDLLLMRTDERRPEHADLLEIRRTAERSAHLTRQLLAFARRQTVRPRILDLNDIVSGMLRMLRRLIGEHINLVWKPDTGVGAVYIDPSQIDQVLANLVVNARDAIRDGGRITISTRNEVFDDLHPPPEPDGRPGSFVALSVQDDGVGMDPAVLDRIFEPFYTTKPVGGGTGLGLSTVYGIVGQNGGFLKVETRLGEGSTFTLFLPRAQGKPEPSPAPPPPEPQPAPERETIMLVEDDVMILKLTGKVLSEYGYRVLAFDAPQAAAAAAAASDQTIDLLITDVVMPEMSGKELWDALRAGRPGLKVLFISGYPADVIAQHGILEAGLHFLQKPFTAPQLAAMIRRIMKG